MMLLVAAATAVAPALLRRPRGGTILVMGLSVRRSVLRRRSMQYYTRRAPIVFHNEEESMVVVPILSTTGSSTTTRNRRFMTSAAMSVESMMVNQSTSSSSTSSSYDEEKEDNCNELIHPDDLGEIPFPAHLSPSSAREFLECPQSFLFQYLYGLKQPTSLVLAKGSMCHKALEHIFDLEPPERTLENLQNMLRVHWEEQRFSDEYKFLFQKHDHDNNNVRDIQAEREWGLSALQLLENYYKSEDPRTIVRPNPYKREVWVNANLTVDPTLGVTGSSSKSNTLTQNQNHPAAHHTNGTTTSTAFINTTFKVRGIVDRIDMVKSTSRTVAFRIVDYKTGKAPTLKYSTSMNQHIFEKNFWQLKIYALLLREMTVAKSIKNQQEQQQQQQQLENATILSDNDIHINGNKKEKENIGGTMELRYLKLHYLNSESGRAKVWEMDLGETQEIRDETLQKVHAELAEIWTQICTLVATQDPKAFVHCDRPFCYCHTCRQRFVPGTVFERVQPPTG